MVTRFDIERAVLVSNLAARPRHLMHVLCIRIDAEAGRILAQYQPSLTDLARDTRRHRRTVTRDLNVLESGGWIVRTRPDIRLARTLHHRTHYALGIPDGYQQARGLVPPGLGAPGAGARGLVPPGLGAPGPEARGPAPHRSSVSSGSSGADLETITKAIQERSGITITPEWAERVREQIIGARDIRRPEAYLRRVILGAPPSTYIPTDQPPQFSRKKGFT